MDNAPNRAPGTPGWKWLVIGLVTACIVALVAVVPALRAPSVRPAGEKEYKSISEGFTLSHPAGWKKLSAEELKKYQGSFSFAVKSVKKPDVLVGVRVQPVGSQKIDLDNTARQMDRTMALRLERFKKLAQADIRIKSGEEALRYEYSFLSNDRTFIRAVALIVPAKENLYFVSALADEKDYAKIKPRIEKAVGSFELD